MLVFFLLRDDNYEKPYSDPSGILPLLDDVMSPLSTVAPAVDIMPSSPTRALSPSSGGKYPGPTTPPKPSTSATSATSLQVQDTPLVIKQSGKSPHVSMTDPKAHLRNVKLAQESGGYFVGPVSADDFSHYVPKSEKEFPFDAAKAKMYEERIRAAAKKNETEMYGPIKEMIEDMLGSVLEPGKFQIAKTATKILTNFFGSDVKPDFVLHDGALKQGTKFQLNNIELMIEVKHDKGLDPFVDDNKEQIEGTTEKSEASLGQSSVYTTCHESIQTRHFVFQVLIIEDYARLLRWDRSGAIVTCKIPLSDRNFFEFFWRFCHLEPSERGWDTTVSEPSQNEENEARRKLEVAEKELGIEGEVQYYSKISLGDGKGTYIAHRIFSGTQSPFGRGTRGYAAYSLTTGEVVFLKSTWRVVGEGRMPEHEIYDILHAKGVKHIPTVVEYAEISDHVTKTQDTPKSWRKEKVKTLRKFQHYYIVFKELCRKLENFQSRKQLLTAFADAAEAHQRAFHEASILHRDISAGNILITREGGGILGDWDMAKHLRDINDGGSQPERTGTFQFLAARFVDRGFNFGLHDRKDDIESFFHTLQWIVLRFVDHGMDPIDLGDTLHQTFDATGKGQNGLVICSGRLKSIQNSVWVTCGYFDRVLQVLLEELRKTINSRYIAAEEMQEAQAAFEAYLNERRLGTLSRFTENSAKQAILFNKLENGDWFWRRLREAADLYTPNEPGHGSTPQKYTPVQVDGAKRTTKSESNYKNSCVEYHVPKKQKLDTGNSAGSKNPGEEDDANNDSDCEPRIRKTPLRNV